MPLVTTNEMLKKAQAGHYAVGAFNVENMEMVMAVIKAAEEMNSPVIMQTTPSTVKYAGLDYYLAMVRTAAERASVPVAIHLDHGSSFELAMQALRTGYTSIMIDGSHGSFEENVALTRRVADACLPSQISVEAELGKVGGKEMTLKQRMILRIQILSRQKSLQNVQTQLHLQLQSEQHTVCIRAHQNLILNALRQSAKLCLFRLYFTELPAYRTTQYANPSALVSVK